LNYPAFQYDGQIVSIANLITEGTGVTITGDGTELNPYVINSTGGGGGIPEAPIDGSLYGRKDADWEVVPSSTIPTLQEVTDEGNETTNDIIVNNIQLNSGTIRSNGDLQITDIDNNLLILLSVPPFTYEISGFSLTANRNFILINESGDLPTIVPKISSFIAVNSATYITNGTLTVTDPTPLTNKGFIVHVIGGTATIGGVDYTSGALVYRFYNGTSWVSKDYGASGVGATWGGITGTLSSQTDLQNALNTKFDPEYYLKKAIFFIDHFIADTEGQYQNSTGIFGTASGTGAISRTAQTYPNRTSQQGVLTSTTGTTATGIAGYRLGAGGYANFLFANGEIVIQQYFTIETLSNATERFYTHFGMAGIINANPTNAIQIVYDELGSQFGFGGTGSANFKCYTSNSSL